MVEELKGGLTQWGESESMAALMTNRNMYQTGWRKEAGAKGGQVSGSKPRSDGQKEALERARKKGGRPGPLMVKVVSEGDVYCLTTKNKTLHGVNAYVDRDGWGIIKQAAKMWQCPPHEMLGWPGRGSYRFEYVPKSKRQVVRVAPIPAAELKPSTYVEKTPSIPAMRPLVSAAPKSVPSPALGNRPMSLASKWGNPDTVIITEANYFRLMDEHVETGIPWEENRESVRVEQYPHEIDMAAAAIAARCGSAHAERYRRWIRSKYAIAHTVLPEAFHALAQWREANGLLTPDKPPRKPPVERPAPKCMSPWGDPNTVVVTADDYMRLFAAVDDMGYGWVYDNELAYMDAHPETLEAAVDVVREGHGHAHAERYRRWILSDGDLSKVPLPDGWRAIAAWRTSRCIDDEYDD